MVFLPSLIARLTRHPAVSAVQLDLQLAERGARLAESQKAQVKALRAAGVGPWAAVKPSAHAHRRRRRKAATAPIAVGAGARGYSDGARTSSTGIEV